MCPASERAVQPPDAEARRRIAHALHESQVVEAAAGTGKTKVLVDRIVNLVLSGEGQLGAMVVVTFTERAAGELKLRVRQQLEAARLETFAGQSSPEEKARRERLLTALQQFEGAHIGTIHGFCAELLREYPVDAGVDPQFEVLGADLSQWRFFERVFQRWFAKVQQEPSPGIARVLQRRARSAARYAAAKGPVEQLREAAWRLIEHRDLTRSWSPVSFDLAGELHAVRRSLVTLSTTLRSAIEARQVGDRPWRPVLRLARALELGATPESVEADLWSLRQDLPGLSRSLPRGARLRELAAALRAFSAAVETFCGHSGANLAPLLQCELRPLLAEYEREKHLHGRLDFADLLLKTRDLLLAAPTVRRRLRLRFSHVLIDEFQDTDPLQAEILLSLVQDADAQLPVGESQPCPGKIACSPVAGRLFIVGDPKQSIYRFRRAEVESYQQIKQALSQSGRASVLQLTTSFRSVPNLQQAINAAFGPAFAAADRETQVDYVPLCPSRSPIGEQPSFIALPLAMPDEPDAERSLRSREPEIVANWIDWLLSKSGWQVSRPGGGAEALRAHHICLLFRSMRSGPRDLSEPYISALQQRGHACVVVGGRSFFLREEIDAIRAALRAIEWPRDELSVYAALRGPLFAFDDETLLLYRANGGRLSPLHPGKAGTAFSSVTAALRLLGQLHPSRNHRSAAETIGRLMQGTRCLSGFAMRSGGEAAVSGLLRLQQIARRFAEGEQASFRAFVEYLELQSEALFSEADAAIAEAGEGGIRMMSVHRSKGLEFPVVLLADAACQSGARRRDRLPGSATDRQRHLYAAALCGCRPQELSQLENEEQRRQDAEALRLLYVAATRARDLLAVPCLPDPAAAQGWLDPLAPILRPKKQLASQAPMCPAPKSLPTGGQCVGFSGLFRASQGEHEVVWWDYDALQGRADQGSPVQNWRLLDDCGPGARQSQHRYVRWIGTRRREIGASKRARWRPQPATQMAHNQRRGALDARHAAAVRIDEITAPVGRPAGVDAALYGQFMHAVLERVDFARIDHNDRVRQVCELCVRSLALPEQCIEAGACHVAAIAEHPLIAQIAADPNCLRELPVTLPTTGGAMVEGIIDLVFRAQGQLHIVDYKTDADPRREQIEAYRRQVSLYVEALSLSTDESVIGHLFFI